MLFLTFQIHVFLLLCSLALFFSPASYFSPIFHLRISFFSTFLITSHLAPLPPCSLNNEVLTP